VIYSLRDVAGTWVPFGPNGEYQISPRIVMTLTDHGIDGVGAIDLVMRVTDGQPWCESIAFAAAEGDDTGVTSEALRALALGRLLWELAYRLARDVVSGDEVPEDARPYGPVQGDLVRSLWPLRTEQVDALRANQPAKRRRITRAFLEEVAKVYRANVEGGMPTAAVAEHFGANHSTAARWVGLARNDYGLLPPTSSGRAEGGA
jgi:hypothetical protein